MKRFALRVAPIVLVLGNPWAETAAAQGVPAPALVAEVQADSTGNVAPIQVLNESGEDVRDVTIRLISAPPGVVNYRLEPSRFDLVRANSSEQFEFTFDVAANATPGQLGELRFAISVAAGRLSAREVGIRLTTLAPPKLSVCAIQESAPDQVDAARAYQYCEDSAERRFQSETLRRPVKRSSSLTPTERNSAIG